MLDSDLQGGPSAYVRAPAVFRLSKQIMVVFVTYLVGAGMFIVFKSSVLVPWFISTSVREVCVLFYKFACTTDAW